MPVKSQHHLFGDSTSNKSASSISNENSYSSHTTGSQNGILRCRKSKQNFIPKLGVQHENKLLFNNIRKKISFTKKGAFSCELRRGPSGGVAVRLDGEDQYGISGRTKAWIKMHAKNSHKIKEMSWYKLSLRAKSKPPSTNLHASWFITILYTGELI